MPLNRYSRKEYPSSGLFVFLNALIQQSLLNIKEGIFKTREILDHPTRSLGKDGKGGKGGKAGEKMTTLAAVGNKTFFDITIFVIFFSPFIIIFFKFIY